MKLTNKEMANKEMAQQALVRVAYIQTHIHNLDIAMAYCRDMDRYGNVDCGSLRNKLFELETGAWREVFMWGLTLEDAERDEIKALAHSRYMSDDMSVAHFMNDGVTPGQWLEKDEEDFRKMAKEYFGGIGGKERAKNKTHK